MIDENDTIDYTECVGRYRFLKCTTLADCHNQLSALIILTGTEGHYS
ncbi:MULTISPECIES: hypothetical protein [unclassified Exiguobacterium]|nr:MULTISPECIES: hypothetical protein [unclassified Exiguobacterium]